MADPKKYISVLNNGTEDLYIKDAEARQDIEEIKQSATGAMHYIGTSTTAIADGDGAAKGPWTIDGVTYIASGTPTEGQVLLKSGDVAIYGELEFVWNATASKWKEFGSTGSLKALAFKDSATGSVTASGSNAPSAVTFTGGTDADFVTGFNDDAVAPTFSEGAFSAGSLPTFTEGSFTPASLDEGFYSAGSAPSFTEGGFTPAAIQEGFATAGSAASFTEGAFSQGTLPSFTEGTFSQGTLPSMTYDQANEKLTFAAGTLPTKAADTFSAGTLPSKAADTFVANVPTAIDTTKFSGGSKAADTFSAGTMTAIDVTKFNGGSKAADTFTQGTLPSKAADTFNAGSAATPTTAKAVTSIGTGEAAAQTFTGSAVSVTVS